MSDLVRDWEWDQISQMLNQDEFEDIFTSEKDVTTNTNRFVYYDTNAASEFIASTENEATKKKTKSDMNQFRAYLKCVGETRLIEQIPVAELDTLFGNFLLGARKEKDNAEYEPSTLRGFMSSFDRYLAHAHYPHKVLKSVLFPHSNQALIAKQKDLKSKGYGNKPNEAAELTDADIQQLFKEGIVGLNTPSALINMLHINCSLILGMRGRKEQRELKWGDIEINRDEDGDEYLVHQKERSTKTRTGQNVDDIRKFKPKAWNIADQTQCPVTAFKLYASKRPASMCLPESPFYLAINIQTPSEGQSWFKASPMGINKIYGLTKNMRIQCTGIDSGRRITNHSVRKHLVQKCVDLNLPPTDTVQITGHKNLQSVNNYSKLNENKQKAISRALNNKSHQNAGFPLLGIENQQPTYTLACQQAGSDNPKPDGTINSISYSQSDFSSYFGTTTISGGTFTFNAGKASPCKCSRERVQSPSPLRKKFKRIRQIESSDSE